VFGGPQPGRQQSLAAAQVEHPRSPEQQATLEDGTVDGICAQLAAGKVVREAAGVAVRLTGGIEQRGARGESPRRSGDYFCCSKG
jgi:hypothetical protein